MSKKIIVAVSGGPDSMALLDILRKKGYDCIVAHVNYGGRATALRDQQIVNNYCDKYKLTFELYKVKEAIEGNFQAAARDIRYDFVRELAKKYTTDSVYVAHHQGDVLETYIMQQKRKITPEHFGINEKVKFNEINIIRPLLGCTKKELINYCRDNNIDYGIDESNIEDKYKRNIIRHDIVEKMSDKDVALMLTEIEEKNKELQKTQAKTKGLYIKFISNYKIDYILSLEESKAIDVLRYWFKQHQVYNLSKLEYLNILEYLKSNYNREYKVNETYSLFKDYQKLSLVSNLDYKYSYTFDEIAFGDYKHFKIQATGKSNEALTVYEKDFPITIRNFQEGDFIKMLYGTKRVSRWFIDNKIPQSKRRSWPIVLNSVGEVILVPKIGCNLTHFSNNPNIFVVK